MGGVSYGTKGAAAAAVAGATYSAVCARAAEALLAAVVGASFAVDRLVVLVHEVHAGGVGQGGCH